MATVRHAARFDWLADFAGASAPALAAGFAAARLAPSLAFNPAPAATALAGAAFGLGLLAMRLVPPAPRAHVLPELRIESPEQGELLLDCTIEEPLLLDQPCDGGVLLLEDRLADPQPGARVVQLFAAGSATGSPQTLEQAVPMQIPDATKALHAALAELRRSLR